MSYYATLIRYSKARYFFVDKPTGSPVEEENIEKIATVKIGELTDEELSLFKSNIVKYKTGPIIELPITSEGLIVCTEFDFCVDSLDEISQLNFSVGVWYFGIYLREVKDDSPLAERVAIRLEIIEPDNEKLPPHLAVCLDIANKIRSERTKPASAAESETTAPAAGKPKTVPAVKEKADNTDKPVKKRPRRKKEDLTFLIKDTVNEYGAEPDAFIAEKMHVSASFFSDKRNEYYINELAKARTEYRKKQTAKDTAEYNQGQMSDEAKAKGYDNAAIEQWRE